MASGSANQTRPDSALVSSDVGSTSSAPTKKRKVRFTRKKTGCRSCRQRRIACPEGNLLSPGVKLPCDKCAEVDEPCYYPHPDDKGRTTTRWVISVQVDDNGRIVPRPAGEPLEILVKQEASNSGSFAESEDRLVVKQEFNPLGPPPAFFPDQQFVSSPSYHTHSPVQPYFMAPDVPLTAPQHGYAVYAESALRNTSQITLPPGMHTMLPYPIPERRPEPGITLPRIPKGIGTSSSWQAVNHHPRPAQTFAYASPVYADPGSSTSRTPYTSFSSASAPDLSHRAHPMPIAWQVQTAGDFQLRLTRMPWVKRKPRHVDYTRSRRVQNGESSNADRSNGEPYDFVDNLDQYWNVVNPPVRPLHTFTLASLSDSPLKRTALSYFETRGCAEIIAAGEMKSNWIYVQLFPRVYDLLSGETGDHGGHRAKHGQGTGLGQTEAVAGHAAAARHFTCEFVHHSLIRLSCVHRANTERDPVRIQELRREILAHGKRAMMAGQTVRIQCADRWWKTEEYLMGAFIGYMADMLDSQTIRIDPGLMAFNSERTPSAFETILRDMLAVYITLLASFRPHDPLAPTIQPYELSASTDQSPPSGPRSATTFLPGNRPASEDWVESFFGLSRSMILQIGRVNSLVAHRAHLLRQGDDKGEAGWSVRRRAQELVDELGGGLERDSGKVIFELPDPSAGKASRVRRGTNVTRLALLIIVLCEILQVDLDDYRLLQARESALEMVADSEASETAGFSWALTVAAVYTRPSTSRTRLTSCLATAQECSFGSGYVATTQWIMDSCWTVIDTSGGYRNGIAPWREAMAVAGRSMYL